MKTIDFTMVRRCNTQSSGWMICLLMLLLSGYATAFVTPYHSSSNKELKTSHGRQQVITPLSVFGGGKKKQDEDLSFIETRDMTREEMLRYNKESEDIMNAELIGMTVFSLVISAPLLYLAWVGLFSETNEIASGI